MFRSVFISLLIASFIFFTDADCQILDSVVLKDGLMIKLSRGDGGIISPNAVAALIETGEWRAPSENEELKYNGKSAGTWKKIQANEIGWINDDSLFNAYVYFNYRSAKEEIILLEGMGHSSAYVNGVQRSGNPYAYRDIYDEWEPRFDYSLIPVKVNEGDNDLVFECNRAGLLKVKINSVKEGLLFNTRDLTLPDLIVNETADTYGAIPVINASENTYSDLSIKTWIEGSEPAYYPVNQVHPLSIYKTPFYIKLPAQQNPGEIKLNVELVNKGNSEEEILVSSQVKLRVLNPGDNHKETFISRMDGSVQYYAVNPPIGLKGKPALFLSLHGAGVEAINQAGAYAHKNWGYIVAPTNRRPYGYNWENWGRLDALEVYDIAMNKFDIDKNRVYLTGHSMGGHGTWHVGINYSDKFAVLGPSAGWISIWGYRIGPKVDSTETRKMLLRSTKHSDTYAFTTNLRSNGIYIIHGSDDDNVPPSQAKSIMDNLSKFHKNFVYHEEPGVGHWWNKSDEMGDDCVDWMPMFDYFAHHAVPGNERVKMVDFVTANPAISSKNYWIEIINQVEQQKMSEIQIHLEPFNRKFVGTTENIEMLEIDASMLSTEQPVSVVLDDQLVSGIDISKNSKISLKRISGNWQVSDKFKKENKNPVRLGNFREALNYDVLFVYGTNGDKEENIWAYEKARTDAEKIWYQGNGSVEIIKDEDFDPAKYKDRSVVLFGNSETNSAWKLLLKDSPVQIDDNKIKIGSKEFKGDDLACLMIRPRTDSDFASVGVVSGTGIKGMKMANLAPYSHPYVSLPDVTIYDSGILQSDEEGVKFTGYFGNDWSLEKGEFISK
ncbi:MAG: prolyl oligopeptidase family serine peptidase [Ignavibacteriaceae bacterium]